MGLGALISARLPMMMAQIKSLGILFGLLYHNLKSIGQKTRGTCLDQE